MGKKKKKKIPRQKVKVVTETPLSTWNICRAPRQPTPEHKDLPQSCYYHCYCLSQCELQSRCSSNPRVYKKTRCEQRHWERINTKMVCLMMLAFRLSVSAFLFQSNSFSFGFVRSVSVCFFNFSVCVFNSVCLFLSVCFFRSLCISVWSVGFFVCLSFLLCHWPCVIDLFVYLSLCLLLSDCLTVVCVHPSFCHRLSLCQYVIFSPTVCLFFFFSFSFFVSFIFAHSEVWLSDLSLFLSLSLS